jgi:hypothetical protein
MAQQKFAFSTPRVEDESLEEQELERRVTQKQKSARDKLLKALMKINCWVECQEHVKYVTTEERQRQRFVIGFLDTNVLKMRVHAKEYHKIIDLRDENLPLVVESFKSKFISLRV